MVIGACSTHITHVSCPKASAPIEEISTPMIVFPQSRPTILAIAIFHFLFAWNDFYKPLKFSHSQKNWTLAVGLQTFEALYSVNTHLIMAASLVMIIPPIIIFFFSQRIFTQGVVFTGIKG
jgi:multiple sugar transport system permease protein